MTSTTPTVQICDTSSKSIKPKPRGLQSPQADNQKLYRRIASLERTQKEQLKAIRDEQTNQARRLRDMPRDAVRPDIRKLTTDPEKYEKDINPLEFYSMTRRSVRFYSPYYNSSDKYGAQPAVVQLTWHDGKVATGLNPTEVEDLREALFTVHEKPREPSYDQQSPYYAVWLKKQPTHLWITLRQDQYKGLCWCACIAKHIRDLRDKDQVHWATSVPITSSALSLSPAEIEDIGIVGMVRESQAVLVNGDSIRGTVPWDIWTEWPEAQAALAKLREEAYPVLEAGQLVDHIQEERPHLESTDLTVVEYTPRS